MLTVRPGGRTPPLLGNAQIYTGVCTANPPLLVGVRGVTVLILELDFVLGNFRRGAYAKNTSELFTCSWN